MCCDQHKPLVRQSPPSVQITGTLSEAVNVYVAPSTSSVPVAVTTPFVTPTDATTPPLLPAAAGIPHAPASKSAFAAVVQPVAWFCFVKWVIQKTNKQKTNTIVGLRLLAGCLRFCYTLLWAARS